MTNTLNNIIIFAAGAVVGALITKKYIEYKQEQQVYNEPHELRWEHESEPIGKVTSVEETEDGINVEAELDGEAIKEYAKQLRKHGYTDYTNITNNKNTTVVEEDDEEDGNIHVIMPEEFGDDEDYETNGLTYYADGVLTDDLDDPIDNVEELIGRDALNHFGDYEYADDAVYIKNDTLKCYYEILLDPRKYSDVKRAPRPNKAED